MLECLYEPSHNPGYFEMAGQASSAMLLQSVTECLYSLNRKVIDQLQMFTPILTAAVLKPVSCLQYVQTS